MHRAGLDAGETRFALQLLRDQRGQAFEAPDAVQKIYLAVVRG